ncbi:hypothetical protein HispidOSU_003001 [Sigmodon hispidus]
MSSPAATRASMSVLITSNSKPEVTVARLSVSSPTWLSHCDPTETRQGQKAERARSPHRSKTTEKVEEPREGTAIAKPEANTMVVTVASTPTPTPSSTSTGPSASPSVTSMKAPSEEPTAL